MTGSDRIEEASPIPERIGPYKILRLVGQGGMGAVYEAEQLEPVRRRVAVKVIKLGMDTRQVVSRFEAERQALAVMDHPNIARMLDAGATEDGRPYFVMELVAGEPITRYCDRHRLSTRERLSLFLQACRAVQHAHQKGVIHRDVKPSNVLVEVSGDAPVVKVIDFGIAKAVAVPLTDGTVVTRLGQVVGSPAYMSPEQAEHSTLDVDTRTDVYSLGVLLYELLVGALPFDRGFFSKPDFVLQYLLRDTEAPRPSVRLGSLAETQETVARNRGTEVRALRRELSGDLDWIVMRAMEKDRTRRYETPIAFAQDIQRHLDLKPVEARPPSASYRLSRFVRRNRAAVTATALVVVVLAGTSSVLARQTVRLAEERDAAAQMADFVEDLFSATDPFSGPQRRDTLSVSAFVQLGAERVRDELADQPLVRARMQIVLGRVMRNLGNFAEARALTEEALAIYEQETGPGSREAIGSRQMLGFVLLDQGEAQEAAAMFAEARDARIAAGMPADRQFGDALSGLGNANMTLGRFEEAEGAYRDALAVFEEAPDADGVKRAQASSNLGAALLRQARYEESEAMMRQALDMGAEVLPQDHPNMLSFANNLAFVLDELGREEEAIEMHRRTLELTRGRFTPPHQQIARSLNNLGSVMLEAGDAEAAEPLIAEAVDMRRALHGPDHPEVAVALHNHGEALRRMGDVDGALRTYTEALRVFEGAFGPEHPRIASVLGALGRLAHERGDHREAFEYLQRGERIRSALLAEDHPLTAALQLDLGRELTELRAFTVAEATLLAAFQTLEGRSGESAATWRLAHERLVELYDAMGRADEAEEYRGRMAALEG